MLSAVPLKRLDPETVDWNDRSQSPKSGVRVARRNGSALYCAMLDKNNLPTSEAKEPGVVVWRLVSSVRKAKVYLSASFRDKRFQFVGEEFHVQNGSVFRLELKTEEPHPEEPFLFPDFAI